MGAMSPRAPIVSITNISCTTGKSGSIEVFRGGSRVTTLVNLTNYDYNSPKLSRSVSAVCVIALRGNNTKLSVENVTLQYLQYIIIPYRPICDIIK